MWAEFRSCGANKPCSIGVIKVDISKPQPHAFIALPAAARRPRDLSGALGQSLG